MCTQDPFCCRGYAGGCICETWHIRLHQKVGDIETWCLWHGDEVKSSPTTKEFATQWMEEELRRKP